MIHIARARSTAPRDDPDGTALPRAPTRLLQLAGNVLVDPGMVMLTDTSLGGDADTTGFHPEARYEFKLHLDGEALERRTFRFTFGERDAVGQQVMALHELTGRPPAGTRRWAGRSPSARQEDPCGRGRLPDPRLGRPRS